jgi:hypothetical protein
MSSSEVLCKVVTSIALAGFPCLTRSRIQWNRMSIARERCCLTELLAIPQAVELSVLIHVGPCV